jgi:DNA-binding MarR family transcriptional regulator
MLHNSYVNKNNGEMDKNVARLLELLLRSEKITWARIDAACRSVNLTRAKFSALKVLMQFGEPVPLGQMAEHLFSVRSNATQMVDRLAAEGLAQRVFDPKDRRTVLAQITEEGRQRYTACMQAISDVEREILEQFSLEEREQFISLLNRLDEMWS